MTRRTIASVLAVLGCAVGAFAQGNTIPPRLKATVMGASKHPATQVTVAGLDFSAIGPFSRHPYLLWRATPALPTGVERTEASIGSWLARARGILGHGELQLTFDGTWNWLGAEVWRYRMEHGGVAVLDAHVDVHWEGQGILGLVNALPGEILSIDAPPNDLSERSWVYWSRRTPPTVELELGWIESQTTREGFETRIVDEEGLHLVRIAPNPSAESALATFNEWPVPAGTSFPDQLGHDATGNVWFTQPPNNRVTRFDPNLQSFTWITTTGGLTPDGMWIDPFNRLWTGLYDSQQLGLYDINAANWSTIPMPYAPSSPAIPVFSRSLEIWVTDHQNNRISSWNPNSSTWTQSVVMPTPSCWVVQGSEAPKQQAIYFTEYNSSQLGKKPWVGPVQDIVTPGGGAAFCIFARNRVYYSNWNADRLGVYNTQTGQFVEYLLPVANEWGGPIDKLNDGRIALGTRNLGFIMVFDPATSTFAPYQIPTPFAGLKDGLTVAKATGHIWFTETGVNKLARLILP